MKPSDKYLLQSLSSDIYLFGNISPRLNFHWWALILLHVFINFMCDQFKIRFYCLICWAWPTNVMFNNKSDITSVSYFRGYFYLVRAWCATCWPLYIKVLHTPILGPMVSTHGNLYVTCPSYRHCNRPRCNPLCSRRGEVKGGKVWFWWMCLWRRRRQKILLPVVQK